MATNHSHSRLLALLLAIGLIATQAAHADDNDIFKSDFDRGTLDTLGWRTQTGPPAHWQIMDYAKGNPSMKIDPGMVLRYPGGASNKDTELLIRKFPAIANPTSLTLTFDGGWGWGNADRSSDDFNVMLLDDDGTGYVFNFHRAKATWAAQWGKVTKYALPDKMNWSPQEIDATQKSVVDEGGLQTFTIKRDAQGAWQFGGANWTGAAPFAFTEPTVTTTTFSQVVLLGKPNDDDLVFNHIHLQASTGP